MRMIDLGRPFGILHPPLAVDGGLAHYDQNGMFDACGREITPGGPVPGAEQQNGKLDPSGLAYAEQLIADARKMSGATLRRHAQLVLGGENAPHGTDAIIAALRARLTVSRGTLAGDRPHGPARRRGVPDIKPMAAEAVDEAIEPEAFADT